MGYKELAVIECLARKDQLREIGQIELKEANQGVATSPRAIPCIFEPAIVLKNNLRCFKRIPPFFDLFLTPQALGNKQGSGGDIPLSLLPPTNFRWPSQHPEGLQTLKIERKLRKEHRIFTRHSQQPSPFLSSVPDPSLHLHHLIKTNSHLPLILLHPM
jgi:hypothetical protein